MRKCTWGGGRNETKSTKERRKAEDEHGYRGMETSNNRERRKGNEEQEEKKERRR